MATSYPVPKPIELVFSEIDGVSIAMDVYIPEQATKDERAPVLLWWHGGGLLQGTRKAAAPHTRYASAKHGLCVVSVDYRLAPQTRLPGILADCKAAIDFVQSDKFAEATSNRVDSSHLIVSGSSAGGWLALLAGTGIGFEASGVEPPKGITGIAAIYPITDLLDPFWSTKHRPVVYLDRIIEHSEMATFVDPNSEKTSWAKATGKRSMFYHYMVQEAILVELLLEGTGIDPMSYSIAQNVRAGKVKALPPTYVITGNKDTKVPYQQSLDVVAAYESVGSAVEYHEIGGVDHRFDDAESEQMESMYWFIKNIF
ncbi:Versiconal hemiacetal acetate esterase [Leucoagaricus sp. SymC.cos]|nr:Versiconal hemiacetal acetate esterase [Leucoagaricus sp. SymC.cos]